MGRFRFDSIGSEDRPREGEGVFAESTSGEMHLGSPVAVELFRFSEKDQEAFAQGGAAQREAVRNVFRRFERGGAGGESVPASRGSKPPS